MDRQGNEKILDKNRALLYIKQSNALFSPDSMKYGVMNPDYFTTENRETETGMDRE